MSSILPFKRKEMKRTECMMCQKQIPTTASATYHYTSPFFSKPVFRSPCFALLSFSKRSGSFKKPSKRSIMCCGCQGIPSACLCCCYLCTYISRQADAELLMKDPYSPLPLSDITHKYVCTVCAFIKMFLFMKHVEN